MILIEFDKAGAEWVIVAYLSEDPNMLEVVQSGKSPHTVTGHLISGCSEELVQRENKLVGSQTDPDVILNLRAQLPELEEGDYFLPRSMSIRQAGKKSNHGLNYDMKYRRFALESEMDEIDAKKISNFYRKKAYVMISEWHRGVRNQLREDRTLVNCFGRRRKFYQAWDHEMWTAAYSFVPQSTVGDLVNKGLIQIAADDTLSFDPLAQVHDSVAGQMQCDDLPAMAAECWKICNEYMNPTLSYNEREFQIGTDIKMGFNWGNLVEVPLPDTEEQLLINLEEGIQKLHEKAEAA